MSNNIIPDELEKENELYISEDNLKRGKSLSEKSVFVVNIIFIAVFVLGCALVAIIPRLVESPAADISDIHDVIDNEWALFLINPENPLPDGYSPALVEFDGTFRLDERCAAYARNMMSAAEKDGITLCVASAYRSVQKQQENLEQYILRLENDGYSEKEAEKIAAFEIAPPGASEHNAGLAIDFLTADWWNTHTDVTADFDTTEEYRWLSENSWKYGFILRYGKDDTDITGYAYEPWHYRFVGIYHAKKIYDLQLTLEEYLKLK